MGCLEELRTLSQSVVGVESSCGSGAGVIIKSEGRNSWVLTCAHVLAEGDKICHITIPSDAGHKLNSVRAHVEKVDKERDLALVRTIKRLPLPVVTIADDPPEPYERIYTCGQGLNIYRLGFEGIYITEDKDHYVFTGGSMPGQSGGAFGNSDGELIGIILALSSSGLTPVFSVGYAAKLEQIKAFIKEEE